MKVIALLALVALAAATAPFHEYKGQETIDGEYLVIFKTDSTLEAREAHYAALKFGADEEIMNKYDFTGFYGYAAKMSKASLASVLEMDSVVSYVEVNQVYHATICQTQTNLPTGLWGLARTVQRSLPTQPFYEYNPNRGSTVDSYIIDTGIMCTHNDFQSPLRCRFGADFTNEGPGDGHGHGTHVAGTVGGETYGIAKSTQLIAVKVLNRQGSGTTNGVVGGINWVANQHVPNGRPSVGNMSLGGGFSAALNDATNACVARGVHMVVASGNSNANACNSSPASARDAITVNSMQNNDARSSFSNFGTCTHIFAPGTNILSSWIGSNSATSTISGTSMAAPHVAGVAAVIAGNPGAPTTPAAMRALLQSDGTQGIIGNPGNGSPNILLFHACLD